MVSDHNRTEDLTGFDRRPADTSSGKCRNVAERKRRLRTNRGRPAGMSLARARTAPHDEEIASRDAHHDHVCLLVLQSHDLRFRIDRKRADVPRLPQGASDPDATAAAGCFFAGAAPCRGTCRSVPGSRISQPLRRDQRRREFRVLGSRRHGGWPRGPHRRENSVTFSLKLAERARLMLP
jgi:hypothetical protein